LRVAELISSSDLQVTTTSMSEKQTPDISIYFGAHLFDMPPETPSITLGLAIPRQGCHLKVLMRQP
jgi:hypothetical protein